MQQFVNCFHRILQKNSFFTVMTESTSAKNTGRRGSFEALAHCCRAALFDLRNQPSPITLIYLRHPYRP